MARENAPLQLPSEAQIYRAKAIIVYNLLEKGVSIPQYRAMWAMKTFLNPRPRIKWEEGRHDYPSQAYLYRWMEKVGQEILDRCCNELGLPELPHLAPGVSHQ